LQLQDNVFFVTGGASGLGEATARMLVESGACVVIADVNEASGERLVSEVYGGTVPFAEEYLVPVTKRQILGRILKNLKMIYLNEGNAESAWPVVEKMVHLDPDSPVDRRDRGLLAHGRNLFPLARSDLRFYLDRRPEAPDRASIQASLAAVEAILSMLG